MLKPLVTAAGLAMIATSAMAAEVGVRHSTGGSHTNTHSGRAWSQYEGSRQGGHQYSGQSSTVSRDSGRTIVGGNAGGNFGVGYGQPDEGDGRGASCERGRASFCASSTEYSVVDRASSEYRGGSSSEEAYRGGSRNSFNGSSWSNFSETSTFAR